MRLANYRPVIAVLGLALPAGAVAASVPGVTQQASMAAVLIWLAGLGWGFHTMLHHRLLAEDQVARLEADLAMAHDAHETQMRLLQQRLQLLNDEWRRFEDCIADGDRSRILEHMCALQSAIALLQQRSLL